MFHRFTARLTALAAFSLLAGAAQADLVQNGTFDDQAMVGTGFNYLYSRPGSTPPQASLINASSDP
jgi:hypothetical protein